MGFMNDINRGYAEKVPSNKISVDSGKTWYIPHHGENKDCVCPYQHKSMGMILKSLGHIWPIGGNGMGRLDDDMELVWDHILPNFKLWVVYG